MGGFGSMMVDVQFFRGVELGARAISTLAPVFIPRS